MSVERYVIKRDDNSTVYVMREFDAAGLVVGASSLYVRVSNGETLGMSVDWHLPEARYAATEPGRSCMALGERCQSDGSCLSAGHIVNDFLAKGRDTAVIWKELEGWLPRWGYPEGFQPAEDLS